MTNVALHFVDRYGLWFPLAGCSRPGQRRRSHPSCRACIPTLCPPSPLPIAHVALSPDVPAPPQGWAPWRRREEQQLSPPPHAVLKVNRPPARPRKLSPLSHLSLDARVTVARPLQVPANFLGPPQGRGRPKGDGNKFPRIHTRRACTMDPKTRNTQSGQA